LLAIAISVLSPSSEISTKRGRNDCTGIVAMVVVRYMGESFPHAKSISRGKKGVRNRFLKFKLTFVFATALAGLSLMIRETLEASDHLLPMA
jgi:hypothetical protein